MGRKSLSQTSRSSSAPVVSARAPTMKYTEASKLADKTSRTIAKLEQLVEVINSPGYNTGDPNRIIERYTEKLKRRVNRRLTKLARWSDSSAEERQAEFRRFYPSSSYNAYRPANSFNQPARPSSQPAPASSAAAAASSTKVSTNLPTPTTSLPAIALIEQNVLKLSSSLPLSSSLTTSNTSDKTSTSPAKVSNGNRSNQDGAITAAKDDDHEAQDAEQDEDEDDDDEDEDDDDEDEDDDEDNADGEVEREEAVDDDEEEEELGKANEDFMEEDEIDEEEADELEEADEAAL